MRKSKSLFFLIISVILVVGSYAEAAKNEEPFRKYTIDGGYFSCNLPENDWDIESDNSRGEKNKVYKILLLGGRQDHMPIMIRITYYAAGNIYFNDYVDFVTSNTIDLFDEPIAEAKKIILNKRNALTFETETYEYINLESKSSVKVQIKEKTYVLLADDKEGFFVLQYFSPKSAYDEHIAVFEKVAGSFEVL